MTVPPSRWLEAAATLGRTFGVRGARLRAVHEVRRRLGRFRRAPRHRAERRGSIRLAPARRGRADRGRRPRRGHRAGGAGAGRRAPGLPRRLAPAAGAADAWATHPETGHAFPARGPWWEVAHLDPAAGDIKDVWEPARFAWLYDLVRAYVLTDDRRYADAASARIAVWDDAARRSRASTGRAARRRPSAPWRCSTPRP